MRKIITAIVVALAIIFAGTASMLYVERLNFRGNGRLAVTLLPDEQITLWLSLPPGRYVIGSTIKGPRESFASFVDIPGIELTITQGGRELFHGALKRSEGVTIDGYERGVVEVNIEYSGSESSEVFVILGRPL